MREMLRIKRSVQATYNIQVNYMAAQMMATSMGEESAPPPVGISLSHYHSSLSIDFLDELITAKSCLLFFLFARCIVICLL